MNKDKEINFDGESLAIVIAVIVQAVVILSTILTIGANI